MRRLIRRLATQLDRGLDAGWDDYDGPNYAAIDGRTVAELDDLIGHLDGARAAARDLRQRLTEATDE